MIKSLSCDAPGKLIYRDAEFPFPKDGEVILKVTHIGICGTDLHAFEGNQPFFQYPRILGHELAAVVEDANGIEGFTRGEQVTIIPYFSCGQCIACRKGRTNCCVNIRVFGVHIDGGMREFISVPATALVKSSGLIAELLALTEPLAIGAHGVGRAEINEKNTILVIGSGPIGLATMMMAKVAGARVIAIDKSQRRLEFAVSNKNADHIINSTEEDALEKIKDFTNGDMPDVVFDATGNRSAINGGFSFVSHGGKYVLIGLQKEEIVFSHPEFHKREATLMSSRNATRKDFDQVIGLISSGKIDSAPLITHRVSFDQVKDQCKTWLDPLNGVIKAMVQL